MSDRSVGDRSGRLRISVVLCTYQGRRFVSALLDSLAGQERRPDELVVIDDGSDDGTPAVVRAFARCSPFPVRFDVGEPHLGSALNFGRALALADGDVVCLADQDDVWRPDKLRQVERCFASHPRTAMLFSDASLIDERGAAIRGRLWAARGVRGPAVAGAVVDAALITARPVVSGCTMAVSRRVIEAGLPLPPVLADPTAPMRHDRWLSLVAVGLGEVRVDPSPLIAFRVHAEQETGILLGLGGLSWRGRSAWAAATTTAAQAGAEYATVAAQLEEAAARSRTLGGDPAPAARAAAHHRHRASLPATRRERLKAVAAQVRHGGYGRGRSAWAPVLADLVRR